MTINEFVVKLKNAGLTASFDENNQRFFISSKSSGADNDFSMTAANSNGKNALGALKLQATTADTVAKDIAKYQTIAGTDKNTYIADTAKSNYDATIEQYNTAIEKLKTSNAELEEKNKKLAYQKQYVDSFIEKANYTGTGDGIYNPTTLDDARKYLSDRESELEAKKTDGTITDDEKLELEAVKTVSKTVSDDTLVFTRTQKTDDDGNVSYTSDVDSLLTSTEASITSNNETIAANNTSINQYYTEAGVDSTNAAQVDSTNGKILLSYSDAITGSNSLATGYQAAATTQYEYAVSMVEAYNAYTAGTATDSQKELLGLSTSSSTDTTSAVRIAGSNAQIELNGAVFENTTNNFSINGLTIQATALTGSEAVTITTDTDVDGIYDTIKDMLSEYNELIKTLDTAYNAESAKGYEPLTDDEKESMSDDEVEKWETKIKDSLLRRDGTLDSVISSMKNTMLAGITIDGKSYNLSTFGISTGSYFSSGTNEKGVFHIDGDEDDSTSKGNTDKLKAAIANDSDTVIKFFSQLANNLYSTLNKKLGTSNSMSSYMSIYNDKEMATQYSEYKSKISDQETKISTWEDYYYKKFSRMESALASLNSQASSISGLFG